MQCTALFSEGLRINLPVPELGPSCLCYLQAHARFMSIPLLCKRQMQYVTFANEHWGDVESEKAAELAGSLRLELLLSSPLGSRCLLYSADPLSLSGSEIVS